MRVLNAIFLSLALLVLGTHASAEEFRFPPMRWEFDFDGITANLVGFALPSNPKGKGVALNLSCSKASVMVVFGGVGIPNLGDRIGEGSSMLTIGDEPGAGLRAPIRDTLDALFKRLYFHNRVDWFRNSVVADSEPSPLRTIAKPAQISPQQFLDLVMQAYSDGVRVVSVELEDRRTKATKRLRYSFEGAHSYDGERQRTHAVGRFHEQCEKWWK